ncbi:MAG: hypothetical protein WC048_10055 [Rhizobium sp.]
MRIASGKQGWSALLSCFVTIAFAGIALIATAGAAPALSELKQILPPSTSTPAGEVQDVPADGEVDGGVPSPGTPGIPDPDPLINMPPTQDTGENGSVEEQGPPPEVIYDIEKAPEPVRRLRQLIIEAAASGDIERLRPLLNPGPNQTQVMLDPGDPDPIATLKGLSGDPDGIEILAILLDVLSTGFVRVDSGTADEMYVWPYFAEKPLTTLTAPEKVELLRIVTAGDYTDMLEIGNYNFFRVGISPDGQWKTFTAGD